MNTEVAHAFVDHLAKLLELVGIGIIIGGVLLAAWLFVQSGVRGGDWQAAYQACRSNLGRGILLGLELLVGADIISTITAPLTFQSVALLGGIVMIRTFLSFSGDRDRGLLALAARGQGSWQPGPPCVTNRHDIVKAQLRCWRCSVGLPPCASGAEPSE